MSGRGMVGVVCVIVSLAVVGVVAASGGSDSGPGSQGRQRLVVLAQADPFEEQKDAYLVDAERESGMLSSRAEELSELYPTESYNTDSAFSRARNRFNRIAADLQAKLAKLRATPADEAQSAMAEVDAALAELRTAYQQLADAAH